MHPSITMYTFTHSFTFFFLLHNTFLISLKGFTHMHNRIHQLQVHILIHSVPLSVHTCVCVHACVEIFSNTGTSQNMCLLVSLSSTSPSHALQMQFVCKCVHACVHMCVLLCLRVLGCMYVCVFAHVFACACVCMCVCVLLWTHGSKDIGIQRYCPLMYKYQKND